MHMTTPITLACISLVAVLVGCAADDGGNRDSFIEIDLKAVDHVGGFANAYLTPQGDMTGLSVIVAGPPPSTTRPVHLYTYIHSGSCERLSDQPKYSLNDRVSTSNENNQLWRYSRSVPAPLSELRSGSHAIVIHSAPSDGNKRLFCGDIPVAD